MADGSIATISPNSATLPGSTDAVPARRPSALLGEALGAHAVVQHSVGKSGGLPVHRLILDTESAAHLPVLPERRIDVLIDPALAGEGRIGLRIAVAQLAGYRLVVGAGLDPTRRGSRPGARRKEQTGKKPRRDAESCVAADHSKSPFPDLRTGMPIPAAHLKT